MSSSDAAVEVNLKQEKGVYWYHEELEEDLIWSFALNSVLQKATSKYQDILLVDSKRFGKVLVIDGKAQSADADEFVYHECLIHPPFLAHPRPKTVFIMGGGEGLAAREALKHRSVDRVVMCDIDKEVVDFCRKYLSNIQDTFLNPKLELVINDAKAELESRKEKYDIIVGDLADPVEGGPCYQLYTQSFYLHLLKPKLSPGGIFVTQAGPAGLYTHKQIFSSIYNTLRQVFKYVVAYTAHIPSYADTWGWVMASDEPLPINADDIDQKIEQRIVGDLTYLDGATLLSATTLSKPLTLALKTETSVYTEETAKFIHGHGLSISDNGSPRLPSIDGVPAPKRIKTI